MASQPGTSAPSVTQVSDEQALAASGPQEKTDTPGVPELLTGKEAAEEPKAKSKKA